MACSRSKRILFCLCLFLVASCHCTRLTKLKELDKFRGNLTLSYGQAKESGLHHGRLLIGQNSLQGAKFKGTKATNDSLDADTDYQADMEGWGHPRQPKGQGNGLSRLKPENVAVEQLLKMEPKVECTGDSMKLQVQDAVSTPGSLFFVDRGSRLSPLPLSKLPPSCGYTFRSTQKELVLVAPYDGCFVAHEEDSYVLPLRWLGLPVRMSCPLMRQSSPNPPMVTCHTEGMVVKTEWTVPVAKIKVNLNGNWEPLMKASPRCGFNVVVHPEGVVISVRYAPCLEKKDGMHTLELAGEGETKISCPSLSPVQPEPTKSPANDPKQQTESQGKGVHLSISSHNSPSASAPEPTPVNPAQSAVPLVPGFPQIPEIPNEKPNQGPKDINQPQLPYIPFYPNYFYPYPVNPDTKPTLTVQPTPPLVSENGPQSQHTVPPEKPSFNPEGQVPQQFINLPFYPWPVQPEVPVEKEPPATQQPSGHEKQPLNPYLFFVKPSNPDSVPPAPLPELKPLPSIVSPVVKTTKDQRQQPFYPYPIYPQPYVPEVLPTEPTVTEPPPGKLEEQFSPNPINHPFKPPQKPVEPSASQSEGQVHKLIYPLPFYPLPPASEASQVESPYPLDPEKPLPEQTMPLKPPVSEEPQGQMYQPFYPYPFLPQGPYQMPVLPTHQAPTPTPKGQVQPLNPLQPEAFKPEALENLSPGKPLPAPGSKEPSQPEAPLGQAYEPFYPYPLNPNPVKPQAEPENQPARKPPQPPQPEAPQGQVYEPFYPYYPNPPYPQQRPENPTIKPIVDPKPPQPEAPQGQVYKPFYPNPVQPQPAPENQPATKPPQPPQPEAPQGQVYEPFYPYYPNPPYPHPPYPQQRPENPTIKPIVDPKPPQPEAPQGQVYQPFYPNPFYPNPVQPQPEPENQPATKPPQPPQPEAPQGQVYQPFYPYPFYPNPVQPQPEPENQPATKPPQPPQPEAPQGQVYQPFYPNPVQPQPEPENQPATKPPQPPQPEAPQGQVYQPFYPYPFYPNPVQPQPEPENQPATKPPQPPQPEAPQGQVYEPFYPYYPNPSHSQPKPENPTTKPIVVPKPPQPEAPQGQVYQPFYPYPFYPNPVQPEPESQLTTKPPQPSQPEAPRGQAQHSFYPYPSYPNPFYPQPDRENHPAGKPTAVPPGNVTPKEEAHKPSIPQTKMPCAETTADKALTEKPPAVQPPEGQVPLYYPQQPKQPQPATLPSANSMQQHQQGTGPASGENPPELAMPKPSNGGIVPQGPQPGSSYMPPVYCPQFCPPGFSNCCPQIAFHQHLHHVLPAGLGNKDERPVYPGLPFLPSVAYPGFGNGFGSTPPLQKPTDATTTSTSASTLPQSPSSGNEKQPYFQPPDGNPDALPGSNPSKPTNPEQQIYPYFVPNSLYSNWPYQPQNEQQTLPQGQSPAHYSVPFQTQASADEPGNPMVQYKPYNIQLPKQQNKLSAGHVSNPAVMSYINPNLQEKPTIQQNKPPVREMQPSNPKFSDSKGPTHPEVRSELDRLLVPYYMPQDAQAPPFNKLAVPNNSTRPQLFVSGSKKYGHEQTASISSEPKSVLLLQHGPPGRELNSFSESLQPFGQGKPQLPKWLGRGMASPSQANDLYMPRSGEQSESGTHLKPKVFNSFKDFWKSITPLGSTQRFPPHVAGKAYQQWGSAANHQANGLNQPIQRQSGK